MPVGRDIDKELFGNQTMAKLTKLIFPHLDSLLWSIIDCIGADDFKTIKRSEKPARELILYLRAHNHDEELMNAFVAAVMREAGLRDKVLPEAIKARPETLRRASLPMAPTSEQLSTTRDLLLPSVRHSKTQMLPFPEIRNPDRERKSSLRLIFTSLTYKLCRMGA